MRRVGLLLAGQPLGWQLISISGAAMVATASFLLLVPGSTDLGQSSDYRHFYRPVAENLLEGRGLLDGRGHPALDHPPGYPLFLAGALWLGDAIGQPPSVVERAVQILLPVAAAVLVFLLARLHWGNGGAWLAAAVWISYPPAIWIARPGNSELLFTPLLVLTMVVFWVESRRVGVSTPRLLALGGLCGATMLVRPAAIGLGVILAAGFYAISRARLGRRTSALAAGLVLLGNAIVVTPWEIWMHRHSGEVLPLSAGGPAAVADGLTFGVRDDDYRQGTWIPEPTLRVMRALDDRLESGHGFAEMLHLLGELALEEPLGMVGLAGIKAGRSWYGTDSQRFEGALLVVQLVYLTPALLALVACLRIGSEKRRLGLLTLALVLYFWAVSMAALSLARYMVPAYALMTCVLPALLPGNRRRSGEPARPARRS